MTAILMFVAAMALRGKWKEERWMCPLQRECTVRIDGFPSGGTITKVMSSDARVASPVWVGTCGGEPVIRLELCNSGTATLGLHIQQENREYVLNCRLSAIEGEEMRFQVAPEKWKGEPPPSGERVSRQIKIRAGRF